MKYSHNLPKFDSSIYHRKFLAQPHKSQRKGATFHEFLKLNLCIYSMPVIPLPIYELNHVHKFNIFLTWC
jgi:hypothetical protein